MRSNELPFERRTFAPDFHTKKALFNQGFRFSLLAFIFPAGPLRRLESRARLNAGSAAADAADRAALKALLLAFIAFFSSGSRFDVFSRRRTGCSASLLRKGNATHEERSANDHEVFLP